MYSYKLQSNLVNLVSQDVVKEMVGYSTLIGHAVFIKNLTGPST